MKYIRFIYILHNLGFLVTIYNNVKFSSEMNKNY